MNEESREVSRCGRAAGGLASSGSPSTGNTFSASGRQRRGARRGCGGCRGEMASGRARLSRAFAGTWAGALGGELAAGRAFQASHWWMWKGDSHSFRRCGLACGDVRKVCSWCEMDCGLLETPDLMNMWETVRERKFMRCLGTVSLSSPACGCFPGIVV